MVGRTWLKFPTAQSVNLMTALSNPTVQLDRFMTFVAHVDNINKEVMGTLVYLDHIRNQIKTT